MALNCRHNHNAHGDPAGYLLWPCCSWFCLFFWDAQPQGRISAPGRIKRNHWLENTVRDLRRRVFGPWGDQQPLMAMTTINLDTFLFYFQLFPSALWHPAALFVLELWQIGLFPTSGIFILCGSLTMSTVAPLHASYQVCFLWLLSGVPYVSELLGPFSHLCNISAPKNKENF